MFNNMWVNWITELADRWTNAKDDNQSAFYYQWLNTCLKADKRPYNY